MRRINFTGSTRVGRIIAQMAAKHLKRVLLELGGKAPLVVLDDADLDEAVKAAVFGSYMNQGQICMSTERIVVDETVADAFVEKFAAKARTLPIGDPRKGNVVLGSLVERAGRRARQCADRRRRRQGRQAGRRRHHAGHDPAGDDRRPRHAGHAHLRRGELRAGRHGRARRAASRRPCASPTTPSTAWPPPCSAATSAARSGVAKRIESGICHVNAPTVHDEPQMPFGGMKASGYGRFGGKAAIDEFTELRWITIQTGPRPYPF